MGSCGMSDDIIIHEDFPGAGVQCQACWGQGVLKQWHGDRSPEIGCDYCDELGVVSEDKCQAWYDRNK